MSRQARRLAGFRPVRETFRGIRWDRNNRLWHEAHKRTDPRFSAACKLDWARVVKRPDTRYTDGRQLGIVTRDVGFQRVVYFLAYVKRHGFIRVISIRYATEDEELIFSRHYPWRPRVA
jgi:uncharacterized DUF497 family protein